MILLSAECYSVLRIVSGWARSPFPRRRDRHSSEVRGGHILGRCPGCAMCGVPPSWKRLRRRIQLEDSSHLRLPEALWSQVKITLTPWINSETTLRGALGDIRRLQSCMLLWRVAECTTSKRSPPIACKRDGYWWWFLVEHFTKVYLSVNQKSINLYSWEWASCLKHIEYL